jgi:hypothetical protein
MGRDLVRFQEISRRPTSAFARRPKLSRTISAFGGKAGALEGGRFCPSLANSGHSSLRAIAWIHRSWVSKLSNKGTGDGFGTQVGRNPSR